MRPPRLVVSASLTLVAVAALVVGALALRRTADRRFRDEVASARAAVGDNRPGTARRLLVGLLGRRPRDAEALYLLGIAEQLRGRPDLARTAWESVPADSDHAGLASLHLARAARERGRLAEAEGLLLASLDHPGPHRPIARWDLVRMLRLQGRFDEAIAQFRRGLPEHPEPVEALRILLKLETDAFPAEMARSQFEQARALAPEDDRVWLGLANVAARSGRFDEARDWLDRCLARRPDDPAVWRSRLDWARAADLPDEAIAALDRLPAGDDPDTQALALSLRAWLASRSGDPAAERAALEELDRVRPGRPEVVDRLAQLALEEGRVADAEGLRPLRTDRERARSAYIASISAADPRGRAAELSRLASHAGRPFDAAAWDALARATDPGAEARLLDAVVRRLVPRADGSRSLASLVAMRTPSRHGASPARPIRRTDTLVPRFVDDAGPSGLAAFVHDNGHVDGRLVLPETGSGGVGLLDYDGDGLLDVYAVQGGTFPPSAGDPCADRLFRNRGDGTFEDVSHSSGIAGMPGGYGHGVAVGDVDDDGLPDLFVTRWRSYALYRNRGDGTFEDATEAAGLGGDCDWPTSAAFADLDGDGDLDLYVCHYLAWDEHGDRTCVDPADPTRYSCNPRDFPALPDRAFRNDGGRFVDVTDEAGIVDRDGRGLGVVAADVDGDGRVDLYVANDMTADLLFLNRGGFRFEEVGTVAGVAANAHGTYQAGMGTACGDLDGDGRLDLLVTNYYDESTTFFRNLGGGFFADQSSEINLAAPSRHLLGFGLALLDANLDGRLDLLSANGHVHDGRPDYPWTMPAQLLLGGPEGRLVDPGAAPGPPFERLHLGRGLAVGDLDNDGRPDAVLLAQNEPLVLLRNQTEGVGRMLVLRLEGTASNRDGVGATVVVEAGGRRRVAARYGGGSYQSAGDPRLHFGLGDAGHVDAVEVRWPSGHTDRFEGLAADAGYLLREGDPAPRTLPGYAPPGGEEHIAGE